MQQICLFLTSLSISLGLSLAASAAISPEEADSMYSAQSWQESAKAYAALVKTEPDNINFLYRLGRSQVESGAYKAALAPLTRALAAKPDEQLLPSVLITLSRAQAALGDEAAAMKTLESILETNARPYTLIQGADEFEKMSDNDKFIALLQSLKPCGDRNYRAFDFWLGEWIVTAPGREGWQAESSITIGNNGCSVHEHYRSPGGYEGRSINFYDRDRKQWNQTWIDNQGSPLHLNGGINDGNMVLSDGTNRITWSTVDNRVRQLWETTTDGGKTWTVAFDGFYEKKPKSKPTVERKRDSLLNFLVFNH